MKTLKSYILLAVVLTVGFASRAQTTPPEATVPTTGAASTSKLLDDVKHIGSDAWSALKSANFANGVAVEPFGLMHGSDFGGGLAVATASTNGVNIGFAVAAISEKSTDPKTGKSHTSFAFYDATLSIQLGKEVTVPWLNIPAFLYIEAGPAANLAHPNTILEQSVAGAKIFFAKKHGSVGVGVGQNSEWSTPFYVLHASWTF